MTMRRALLQMDLFREVHPDLTSPSFLGSLCSLLAVFACGGMFMCELQEFLHPPVESWVVLDT